MPMVSPPAEIAELRVGLAEMFAPDAREAVAEHKQAADQTGAAAARPLRAAAIPMMKRTMPFQRRFIKLAWMARVSPRMRENNRPRHVGDAPPQFAVHEIGDAAEEQADGGNDRAGSSIDSIEILWLRA